ncbi:malto-oligosyltrehalose synthase [Asaia krungthepensis]|uniref:1,4-alpha-D-glucan 1-alpha-D-glucosylmutase n=1 Tax=Asaia krungthepensis NRIC 0535 TaxID=1307925 RepID=A0ABQ0Q6U1_9PROT|nr:malto-oligosyltrehalose synthase [Asaia krungthepensis]GBQ93955.1 1,4-alpha-D-glucan 1-alpha-D-glucosylmutase [Asaia krungthepensis NRIC 0535]
MTPLPLTATLRLQFHREFTFDDALPLIPYFRKLGISHIYASPLLASTPGSMHGYDTVDCQLIDPDRGGIEGLRRLVSSLREEGMGLILDIVPNHMGLGADNRWWMDVLRHGQKSAYAQHFDIDWTPSEPSLHGRVLLPFLGAPLADILTSGDLKVDFDSASNTAQLTYGEQRYPLSPESEARLLADIRAPSGQVLYPGFLNSEPGKALLSRLTTLLDPHSKSGRARMSALLDEQHYRLAWWRVAGDLINWRRFFDVTSLVALRMDRRDVFDDAHRLVFELYREGLIDGLRVDHVDGLARPAEYCSRLRARLDALQRERPTELRGQAPFFIEKILQKNEILPLEWPVTGTTGYDFLEQVDLLLHDPKGEEPITALWSEIGSADFETVEHVARHEKLDTSFTGEFAALTALLVQEFPQGRDLTRQAIGSALRALLTVFPVYRSYFADGGDSGADFRAIDRARHEAAQILPPWQHEVLDQICQYLADARIDTTERQEILERFEHLTAPLTAKAGEDTAFYRYARLLSRNDVGCSPARFAAPASAFHAMNKERLSHHPLALLTTATHDHKRGEDGRTRLMVLSEADARWPDTARSWAQQTESDLEKTSHGPSPVAADRYFIFQTLISSWPLHESEWSAYPERLDDYLTKALREAGERTSWSNPDEAYEEACLSFARSCASGAFKPTIAAYLAKIGPAAALNSLSQALLRMTSPGVPDLYQGRECWDFSLVDPDNRRPVDYPAHEAMLAQAIVFDEACANWKDGRVKQALVETVLTDRMDRPALYESSVYLPLIPEGPLAEHFVAFERESPVGACLVIAPRLTLSLSPDEGLRVSHAALRETTIPAKGSWRSLLHDDFYHEGGPLSLGYLIGRAPLDFLIRRA